MCHGQILDNVVRTARKKHHCSCCGREIAPRERYERQVHIDDGIRSWKGCRRCAVAVQGIFEDAWRAGDEGEWLCYTDQRQAAYDQARDEGWRSLRKRLRAIRDRLFGKGTNVTEQETGTDDDTNHADS